MRVTYQCPECSRNGRTPATLNNPGVCAACHAEDRLFDADRRLSRAVTSIHTERRWAHLDSGLMPERLNPIEWLLNIGGIITTRGIGYASLRAEAHALIDYPRLVISGAESGIGKTSFAVALYMCRMDNARLHYVASTDEPRMDFAEHARFVAAIDISDPMSLRMAHTASLAVLDDAGQEGRCGGWKGQDRYAAMGDVLDRRERNPKRKTIVTTYGNRDQWGAWYGGRVTRLYWDMPTSAVLEMRRAA